MNRTRETLWKSRLGGFFVVAIVQRCDAVQEAARARGVDVSINKLAIAGRPLISASVLRAGIPVCARPGLGLGQDVAKAEAVAQA